MNIIKNTDVQNVGKIFILSDLHFGVRSNSIAWKDMAEDYLSNEFIRSAKENGLNKETDELFILGDIFNSRESLNVMIIDSVIKVFKTFQENFKNVRIIVGNHDTYYIDTNDLNSVEFIQMMLRGNITVYKEPEQIVINDKKILMLPWIKERDDLNETVKSDDSDFIFCHAELNGMTYSDGTKIKDSLSEDNIYKYTHIYSGHIHTRQEKENITYVGTPYQLDWGDFKNIKGYYVIDCKDDFYYRFIENSYSPMYQKIMIYSLLDYSVEKAKKELDNCYVNVICDQKTYNYINLIKFSEQLKELGVNFIKISFEVIKDITDTTTIDEALSDFKFDVDKESRNLLSAMNKTKEEQDGIMDYMMNLYNTTKKIRLNGGE